MIIPVTQDNMRLRLFRPLPPTRLRHLSTRVLGNRTNPTLAFIKTSVGRFFTEPGTGESGPQSTVASYTYAPSFSRERNAKVAATRGARASAHHDGCAALGQCAGLLQ